MNFVTEMTFIFIYTRLQTLDAEVKHESPGPECSQDPGPVSPPAISLLSPKAMETAGRILRFQEEQREKAKVRRPSGQISSLKEMEMLKMKIQPILTGWKSRVKVLKILLAYHSRIYRSVLDDLKTLMGKFCSE